MRRCDTSEQQHLRAQRIRYRGEILGRMAAQKLDRLPYLHRVAARVAERTDHRRDERYHRTAAIGAQLDHRLRQLDLAIQLGEKRTAPAFDVEYETCQTLCELLAHYAGRDQRYRLDSSGCVAERVQLPVRRGDLTGLPDERAADAVELRTCGGKRQVGPKSGDRFQLVQRTARVTEPAPRHHRHRDA